MALKQVSLGSQPMAASEEKRLLPGIDVDAYDRLHLMNKGAAAKPEVYVALRGGGGGEGGYAALSYLLISPPRTDRRLIRCAQFRAPAGQTAKTRLAKQA